MTSSWTPSAAHPLMTLRVAYLIMCLAVPACDRSDSADSGATNGTSVASSSGDDEPAVDRAASSATSNRELDGVIEVPDGTPEDLFAWMAEIEQQELGQLHDAGGATPESSAKAIRRLMRARIDACDTILSREIPEETRLRAIQIKLDALRTLTAIAPDEASSDYESLVTKLESGNDPLLARVARASRFQMLVNDFVSGQSVEPARIVSQLDALLNDPEVGPETLDASREAVAWIIEAGDVATAADCLRAMGQRYARHSDAVLAEEGKSLLNEAHQVRLTKLARDVMESQPEALDNLLTALSDLMASDDDDPDTVLAYAMQTAQLLEFTGHFPAAKQAYAQIEARYENDEDPQLQADVKRTVELAMRRLNLVGQPLELAGVRLRGDAFHWDDFRGKWVIVSFWTSWHQGWPAEAQILRQAMIDYSDQGLEIVTISLDDDRNALERYVKDNPSPWPTLVDADPDKGGFENDNAVRCGVETIPFTLLVDPEGNVVDIHLLGNRLGESLASHLGSK